MAYDSIQKKLSSYPTGITLGEISRCLQDYRRDTNGRIDLGMMCTSPNINKNALYKPYEIGVPINPSFNTGGPDGTYGYTIPVTFSNKVFQDLKDQVWVFNPPTQWHRQSDFDGYIHIAEDKSGYYGVKILDTSTDQETSFRITFENVVTSGEVNPYEMVIFNNAYYAFSIFLYYASGPDSIAGKTIHAFSKCCDNTIGSGLGQEVNETFTPESLAGEYAEYLSLIYIVPFISEYTFNEARDENPSLTTGRKWVVGYPNYKGKTITVGSYVISGYEVDCEFAEVSASMGIYSAEFTYTFNKSFTYLAPTYKWEVVNPNTGQIYTSQDTWLSITSGLAGEKGDVKSFAVNIAAGEGAPVPSGYKLKVYHKEQTGADGSHEVTFEYMIP